VWPAGTPLVSAAVDEGMAPDAERRSVEIAAPDVTLESEPSIEGCADPIRPRIDASEAIDVKDSRLLRISESEHAAVSTESSRV
jgi:hypothetical protein